MSRVECDWCNQFFEGERDEETGRAECDVCAEECREMRQRVRARILRDQYVERLYADSRRLVKLARQYQAEGRPFAILECAERLLDHKQTIRQLRATP